MEHSRISAANGAAPGSIRRSELLSSFSYALDITEGQPEGHSMRAAWIACELGKQLGLAAQVQQDLFYSVLLKDLGCSSNAARICDIYVADDRSFKHDFKLVGPKLSNILAFVFSRTAAGTPLLRRAKAVVNILRNGSAISRELIQTRCERGADIARQLRFSDEVAGGIYHLDEHWNGSGKPDALKGEAIPLLSRIALLAQVVDVFHTHKGPAAAAAEVARRSGTWFDPRLARAFASLALRPAFWERLASPALAQELLNSAAAQCEVPVDEDLLDDVAAAFGAVVDAKSPYTSGHSERVADYCERISVIIGYDPARRRWLRRGALLHDIGKLGVSNSILDKPARLDAGEWVSVKMHATQTRSILSRISAFGELAPIAAAHHERLDGRGYPHGLADEEITLETRIITVCDIFDALTADRPYRRGMTAEKALEIISLDVGKAVDATCYEALRRMVEEQGGPAAHN